MDIPIAVIADAANVSREGTLNILGIFSEIKAAKYPASHPAAVLVVQLRARSSERGQRQRITVRLMSMDAVLAEVEGQFQVPSTGSGEIRINQIFRLAMMQIPAAGDYSFHILLNGEERQEVPFRAVLLPDASPGS